MASPAPEAAPADNAPRDTAPETEQKPEVNGHGPTVDSKPESDPVATNGHTKEGEKLPNGVNEDVEMGNAKESESAAKVSEGEPKESSPKETDSKSKEEDPDVAMQDAAPAPDTSKDTADKPAEPESSPVQEANKDSEMTDKPSDETAPQKVNGTVDSAIPSSDPVPASESDSKPVSLSQLAIESETTAKPSIEVAMEDAPSANSLPSVKVAREREDDAMDEPAPKRAKTEPREEEPAAAIPTSSSAPAETPSQSAESTFAKPTNWDDPAVNAQQITPYQRREVRKVLGRVKKTKHGGHFRDSVQKLWPQLWESYNAKIDKPTDLSEIDRNMRDPNGPYQTMGDFKGDLLLMYENTLSFNGAQHDVTNAAQGCIRSIWEDVVTIPQEEPAKPKPIPKQKPPRESRAAAHTEAAARKMSAGPAMSPAREPAPAPKPQPAQESSLDLRRASTATEGDRPKRTVRAPKPKDIDYTTKPSRKKLKPELQFCEEVLNEIMQPKHQHINGWFLDAVDAEGLAIPQYYSIIKKPMDLGKVSRMLSGGDISSLKEFDKNVKLIFTNCYTFNGSPDQGNPVSLLAKQLEDLYTSQMKGKDAWLAKHAKANAPPPASNASDDEEEEEEVEDSQASAELTKEIQDLEHKLREESEKLTDLFTANAPNQALISVQQNILAMVQDALLKKKQSLGDLKQKPGKPSKKAGKPSKAKAAGGASRKSQGAAAAHPKKAGGSKKAAQKKSLTAADKDQIANAINDLEYPHLDRAIEIIKRDTGQNENNQGELELDIDQLSNEALLKLWELCKRVLPGFGKDASQAVVSSPELSRAAPKHQPKTAAKPKKNKPMSAREQEERIAQLKGLRELYRPGQDPDDMQGIMQAPTPTADSSDDSDSEEE